MPDLAVVLVAMPWGPAWCITCTDHGNVELATTPTIAAFTAMGHGAAHHPPRQDPQPCRTDTPT